MREFPDYLLEYQEIDGSGRLVYRLSSRTDDWNGSLFDFYFLVYHRILQSLDRAGADPFVQTDSYSMISVCVPSAIVRVKTTACPAYSV
ncbi:MAG TPA: hypothetical protein H9717_14640 [Candidatus Eisenbergiella merdipullorum]|uniref:Uncharacterized protein n=1 Tax=Candidatus Eisenbergiella merdipullorum TaxID=2838553 RepID=A0A9D2I7E2_9FIRM|nr:hypothetical protein [Candidatus Eisenbergiella merdipullorum]